MPNEIELKIDLIELYSIEFSLSPGIPELTADKVSSTLNNNNFYDYNIYDISEGRGEKYRITPLTKFSKYDFLSIQIIDNNLYSNKMKIYFCKYFSESADLNFKLPENTNGKYKVILSSVNGYDIGAESEIVTVSYANDIDASSVTLPGGDTYHIDEDIIINVELIDINNNHVPDGNYLIEVKAVRI